MSNRILTYPKRHGRTMRTLHAVAILCGGLAVAVPTYAQNAGAISGSGAVSDASSGSSSGANAGITLDQSTTFASGSQRTGGTSTLRTAPDAIAPSLGSGHPCMINTSLGISIIGGGASGGTGEVDIGCMMMRSSNVQDNLAGRYFYAAQSADACKAWRQAGAIPSNSVCGKEEQRTATATPATSTSTKSPVPRTVAWRTCSTSARGVEITFKRGADPALAQAQCLAKLGL